MKLTDFKHLFKSYIKELTAKENTLIKIISSYPNDNFYTVRDGKRIKYYKKVPGSKNYQYVTPGNIDELRALEEKNYYTELKDAIDKELSLFTRLEKQLSKVTDSEGTFLRLPNEKKHLLSRVDDSILWNDKVDKFESFSLESRVKKSGLKTHKGEAVRSKSELIIAERLAFYGVPYRYEPSVIMDGELEIWHLDFEVMNKHTGELFIWEHFGMIDNNKYCDDFLYKLERYEDAGYYLGENLIISAESSTRPLRTKYIDDMIEHYLL